MHQNNDNQDQPDLFESKVESISNESVPAEMPDGTFRAKEEIVPSKTVHKTRQEPIRINSSESRVLQNKEFSPMKEAIIEYLRENYFILGTISVKPGMDNYQDRVQGLDLEVGFFDKKFRLDDYSRIDYGESYEGYPLDVAGSFWEEITRGSNVDVEVLDTRSDVGGITLEVRVSNPNVVEEVIYTGCTLPAEIGEIEPAWEDLSEPGDFDGIYERSYPELVEEDPLPDYSNLSAAEKNDREFMDYCARNHLGSKSYSSSRISLENTAMTRFSPMGSRGGNTPSQVGPVLLHNKFIGFYKQVAARIERS